MVLNPVTTNFLHQTRNLMYFDNIPMYNMTISQPMPEIDCTYNLLHERPLYATQLYRQEVNLSFDVMVSDDSYDARMRVLNSIHRRYGHSCDYQFGILGTGWVCQNCGDYNPSGRITCIKCGGQAKEDFVKPMQFPFMISDIAYESMPIHWNEMQPITIEMVGYGDKCVETVISLLQGQNVFYANGYSLESGYYLCNYCGQSVPEGETCSGCGGKRMTFQELVKLNRKCVYCGRHVFGGHVCKGCGARIKGLTFKKAFEKSV